MRQRYFTSTGARGAGRRAAAGLAGLVALSLAGCGGSDVSRSFGLVRDAPNEFEVTTRAPLSMPPDFTLRQPQPGASRPQEQTQRQQAEATLAPQVELAGAPSARSAGEQALVADAGPAAPADIRDRLGREKALDAQAQSFTDRLMFWKAPPPAGVVVDPVKEAQRLRENAALGRSVQAGDTPIIQRKKTGWFDGLIDYLF